MVMPFSAQPSANFCTTPDASDRNRLPAPNGSSYDQLKTKLCGISMAFPVDGARVSIAGCRMNAVSSVFE